MIGLDTGFFVALLKGKSKAVEVWEMLVDGKDNAIVSCITILELERLARLGTIKRVKILVDAIMAVCRVGWLDNVRVLSIGARLGNDLGIPVVDALVLASFVDAKCKVIYTTDAHIELYGKKAKGVSIINLMRGDSGL